MEQVDIMPSAEPEVLSSDVEGGAIADVASTVVGQEVDGSYRCQCGGEVCRCAETACTCGCLEGGVCTCR